jgi:hypothetical protein
MSMANQYHNVNPSIAKGPNPVVVSSNISPASYSDPRESYGYKHSDRCIICTARDKNNMPLRDFFDTYAMIANKQQDIDWFKERGVVVTDKVITSHLHKHAPYVLEAKKNASSTAQKMIVKIHQEKTQVTEALQRIIDIGDTKVQSGDLPVTERLYVEALKEQGRRGVKTTMDTEFETMDADFINKAKQLKDGSTT